MTQFSQAALGMMALVLLTPALAEERQTLKRQVPRAAVHAQAVGRLPASSRLDLAIGLPLRNQDGLATFLELLYDPASPEYRHYLTPQQFAESFCPTQGDYEAVRVWAESHGLAVRATHPNRTLLDVSGSVEDIERTFRVTLGVYQHPTEARTFHAPDADPSLDLDVRVLHVSGLDNLNQPRSSTHSRRSRNKGLGASAGGSGPGGGFLGNDFRSAYAPGVALTGVGQSVALVEFDGYYTSDITKYESLAKLPEVPLKNVLIDGFNGQPGPLNLEVALDIEMAISMSPGLSSVLVYEAPLSAAYVNDVLNRIATDNLARQISSSWWGLWDQATDQIFRQYAAQGQSFFEISGDFDAYPSSYLAATGWAQGIAAPTDNPFVTIVGGTELSTTGPGGPWLSEAVWNLGYFVGEAYSAETYSVGSSGGTSPTYSLPSWQKGLSMVANRGSTTRRNFPDVAMVADNIWLLCNNGDSFSVWGTSASAPLWAGFTALANQLAEAHGQPPVGFINPAIYALGKSATYNSLFHDITIGDNNSSSSRTGFPAVAGYDLCTGWGTPNGSNLLYALALPQTLQIVSATNFVASGPPGGPFSPMLQDYSLSNSGAASLDWMLGYAASWLDASPSSGTIAPGAPATTVTSSLNSAANNLPVGIYFGTVWFTNLNDGSVQSRCLTLAVVTAPVIVSGPVDQVVPEGGTTTFTVSVIPGSGPVSFQWNRGAIPLADDGRIDGVSTRVLTLHNVSSADAGAYWVVVSNIFGSVTNAGSMLTVIPVAAPGITLATLYDFKDANDGANPSGLIQATNGNLYGTANSGGTGGAGTVFRITTNGTLTSLHAFTGGSDGGEPKAGLIQARDGNFYGTAYSGGASYGGTAFRMSASGALTTLHGFGGGSDGYFPFSGLVQANDSNLYGTTSSGGVSGSGTVFKLTTNGAFTSLHHFGETEGTDPRAQLIQGNDGLLYGTTDSSGSNLIDGTVFRITTTGTLTTLFTRATGFSPRGGLLAGSDDNFYGTTADDGPHGSGTVFRMTGEGLLTTLYSFTGGSDGQFPIAALVEGKDGYFYGTTSYGGAYANGTAFRMSPSGVLTTLIQFAGFNGANPAAALVQATDGNFYGTTLNGGVYGDGTVFRLSISAPTLSIELSGSQIVLSWPAWASELALQQTSDLTASDWTTVTNLAVITNLENQITLAPPSSSDTFYRLAH